MLSLASLSKTLKHFLDPPLLASVDETLSLFSLQSQMSTPSPIDLDLLHLLSFTSSPSMVWRLLHSGTSRLSYKTLNWNRRCHRYPPPPSAMRTTVIPLVLFSLQGMIMGNSPHLAPWLFPENLLSLFLGLSGLKLKKLTEVWRLSRENLDGV